MGAAPSGAARRRRRPRSTAPASLAESGSDHDRALALYRLGRRAVQDGQPRDRRGGARRGAALRRGLGRAVRRAAGAHPEHARQDPPPAEGLHRRLRGRDGGARARARRSATTASWPRRTSTRRSSPSGSNEYTQAREYAERSKALFERVADHEYVGKLLNNLGQLRAITGRPDEAVPLLREAFRIAVEQDNRVDAAFAASSLASARLHSGDPEGAVESADRAIELLGSREEYRQEEGNARLVMGRAHLACGRIDEAERSFCRGGRLLHRGGVDQSHGRGVGSDRRCGGEARRRGASRRSLPARGGGAARRALVGRATPRRRGLEATT